MSVTLVVFVVGAAMALVFAVVSKLRRRLHEEALSPDRAEHWLVQWLASHSRIADGINALDRRVAGGAIVVVSLAVVWGAATGVGLIFDSLDTGRGFARWDDAVATWGSEHSSSTSTSILSGITHLGDTVWLLVIMAVIGGVDFARRRNAGVLWFLGTVGVGVSLLNNTLKWLVSRDRPEVPHLVGAGGWSFPSGHSAGAAACWAAIALVVGRSSPRRLRPYIASAAVGIAVLVATSRALLGVHWLTDVIAGLIVGWTWFFLVAVAFGGRALRLGEPAEQLEAEVDQTLEL